MVSIVSAQIVTEGEPNKLTDIDLIFGNVISFILPLGSIVLFVMIIYGGIKYITAGPNPSAVQNAKSTLTYAIVGVVLLAMAYMILVLIQFVTGANVTEFSLESGFGG